MRAPFKLCGPFILFLCMLCLSELRCVFWHFQDTENLKIDIIINGKKKKEHYEMASS